MRDVAKHEGPAVAALLRERRDEILQRWEAGVRQLPRARDLSEPALLDHVPDLLDRIFLILEAGEAPSASAATEEPREHALHRLRMGFDAAEVVAELALLRRIVLQVWSEARPLVAPVALEIERAIDDAAAASVETFSRERERALREKEAELHRAVLDREREGAVLEGLLEHAPVGIGVWDRDLRSQRVNRRLAELAGRPPEAAVGIRPAQLLPGLEGLPELEARWGEVLRTGRPEQPREIAGETPAAPGVRRSFVEQAYPVRVGDEVVGVGAVVLETTEQQRVEEELSFLAEASRELADWTDAERGTERIARLVVPRFADWCSFVLVDEDGHPRRTSLHGGDAARTEEARRIADVFEVDESEEGIGAVLRDGRPRLVPSVQEAREARDGRRRAGDLLEMLERLGIRSYLSVPLSARGRISGALSLGTSTARRRLDGHDLAVAGELARRCAVAIDNARLFREARDEAELRQRVLAIVSHDLRNPLSAIRMSAARIDALAPAGEEGEKLRRTGDTIRRSADRMNRLIGDLLDAAAIQAGRLHVEPTPQQPLPMLREVADAFRGAAREKGLAVEVEAPEGLPPVLADRDRVVQVLSNLVGNAVEATSQGRIVLGAEVRGDRAELRVSDTGTGIPPELLPRLFDPYSRGAQAGYKGTGLGLSIVRGIIAAHGGTVAVESEPGRGSTFRFTLPLA